MLLVLRCFVGWLAEEYQSVSVGLEGYLVCTHLSYRLHLTGTLTTWRKFDWFLSFLLSLSGPWRKQYVRFDITLHPVRLQQFKQYRRVVLAACGPLRA